MIGIHVSSALSQLPVDDYSNENVNYSNDADALEYHDSNENTETEQIITESFLQPAINDGDPVIADPSEKIEPGTSNEYIEVEDDYKETDLSILQTARTTENIDLEPELDAIAVSAKESN